MITERTLRKWRADALQYKQTLEALRDSDPNADTRVKRELCDRILKLTQEYLDQYLIGRGK